MSDDLLPKPELDFSQVPSKPAVKKRDRSVLQNPIPVVGAATQKLTWALLLLAMLGLGIRYGHWLDFLMRPKVAVVKSAGPAESMAPTQSVQAGPTDEAVRSEETEKSAAAVGAAEKSQTVAEKAQSETTSPENAEPNERAPERADGQSVVQADTGRRKSKTSATVRGELPPKDAEPAGQELLVPAKVLKSVNPVYPPDAMRSFITGDVTAEVEVGPTGNAGDVKVLSGPTQLRKAAVDAVKRYEFSPATRGGKALPSKLIVAVKFWFNP
jgi:protein TonB